MDAAAFGIGLEGNAARGSAGNVGGGPARQTRETPVAARVRELERRVERQESEMRELALRMGAGSRDRAGEVVARMECAFKALDHVVGVHYAVLQDGTWHVVVVHDMEDGGGALRSICKKAVEIQDACGVEIAPVVLHVDEVRGHLAGTEAIFERPRG